MLSFINSMNDKMEITQDLLDITVTYTSKVCLVHLWKRDIGSEEYISCLGHFKRK